MIATGLPRLNAGPCNQRSPLTTGANNGGRVSPSNINAYLESNSTGAGGTQPGNNQPTISINGVHELCRGILSKMNGFDGRLIAIEDKLLKSSDARGELKRAPHK